MDQQPLKKRDDNPFVELTKDDIPNPSIRLNRGNNSAKSTTTSEKSESESSSTGPTPKTPQFPDVETDSKVLTVQERKDQLLKSAEKKKAKRNSPGGRKDDLKCVTDNLVERLIQKNYNDSMIANPVMEDDNANNGSSTEPAASTECKINIPKISREELIIDTKSRILQYEQCKEENMKSEDSSDGAHTKSKELECRGDNTSHPSEQKMDVDVDSQKRSAKTAVCDASEKKKKKSNEDIHDCSAPRTKETSKNCLEILEDAMSKYEIQESDDEPMEEKTVIMETQEVKYEKKGSITRYREELEQRKLRERIAAANAKGIYFVQSREESGQEEKHNSENILNLLHLKTVPVKIIEARLEEETAATKEMSPKELADFMEQSRREKKSSLLDNTNVEMETENDANANVVESRKPFRERLNQAKSEGFFYERPLKREQEILIRKIEELEEKLEQIFEYAEKRKICIGSQEEAEEEKWPTEKVDLTEYMVKIWSRRNKKYHHLRAIVGWELTTEDLEEFLVEPTTDNLNEGNNQSSINENYNEDVRALLNRIVERETNSNFSKHTSPAEERVETSSDIAEKKRRLEESIADSKAKGLFFESSESSDDEDDDDDDDDEDDNDDTPTRKSDQDSDTPPSPPSSQSGVLSSGNEDASSGDNGGKLSPKKSQKRSPKKSKDTSQQDTSEVMEAETLEDIKESANVELVVPNVEETEEMEVDAPEKISNQENEGMEVIPSDCNKESSGTKTKDVESATKEKGSSICEERLQIDLDRADGSQVPKEESQVTEASGSQSAEASSSGSGVQRVEANEEKPHMLFIQGGSAIRESFFSLEQAKMIRDCITDVDLFQRAALAALRAEQQPVIPNIKFRIPIPPEIEPVLPENLRALYGEKGNPTLPPMTVKAEASTTQSTSPTVKFEYVSPKVKEEPVEAAPSTSTTGKSDGDNPKRARPFHLLEDAGISVAPDSTVMLAEDDGSIVRQLLNRAPLLSYNPKEEEVMLRVMQKYGEQCADYKDLNNPEYKEALPDQPYSEKVPDLGDEPTDTEILPSKRRGIVYPVENPENPEHHHHHHHDPQPAQPNTVEEPVSEQDQQTTPEEESTSEPEPTPAPQPTPEPQNPTTEATLKPKSSNSSPMPIVQGSIVSADMPSLSDPPSPPVCPIPSDESSDDSSSDDETSDEDENEDSNVTNAAQLQTTPIPLEAAEAPEVQSPIVSASGDNDERLNVDIHRQINPCQDPVTLRQPYPPRRPRPPPVFPMIPAGDDGDAEEVNTPPDSPMPQSNELSMPREDYPVTIFDDPADNPDNQPRLPAEPQRPPSPEEVEQNIPPRAQGKITREIVIHKNFFGVPAPKRNESKIDNEQQCRKPIESDSPNTNNTMINVLCHNRRRAISTNEPKPPKFTPIFHPDTNNEFASDLKGIGDPRRKEMVKTSESLVTDSPLANQEQQLDVPLPFEAAEDEATMHAVKMPTHANPPPEIIIEKIPSQSGNDNVDSIPTNNQPQPNSQEDRPTKHQETSTGPNRVVDESIDGVMSCVETSGGEEPNEERAESNPSEQGETPQESTAQKSTAPKSTEACPSSNVAGSLQMKDPADDEDKSTQKRPRPKSADPLTGLSELEKEKQATKPKKYKTDSKSDDDSTQTNTRPGNPHLTRSKDASSVSSSPEYLVPIQNPNIQLDAEVPGVEGEGPQEPQGSQACTSKRKEAPTPEIPEGGPNKIMAREDGSGRIISEANEVEPVANQPEAAPEPVVRPARITRRRRAVESESELSDLDRADRGQSFFSESGISGFDDSPEEDLLSEPSSITPELPVDPLNNTERSDRLNEPSPPSSAITPKDSTSSAQSNENTLSAFSDDQVEEPVSTPRITPEAFLNTLPQDAEFLTETFYYRRVASTDQSVDVFEIVPPQAEKRKRASPTDEAEAKKIKTEEGGEETGEGDQEGDEQSTESKPEEVSDCDREVEAIMANQVRNDSLREGEAGPSSHTQTRLVTFFMPLDNAQRMQVIVHPPKPRESSFVAYVTPKKTEETPKSNPSSSSKGKNPSPKKATRRSNVQPAQDSPGSRRDSLRSTKQANKESTESKPTQKVASSYTQVGTAPARGDNTKTQQKSFTTRQWSRSKPVASQVSSTTGAPVKKNANEQKKNGGKCKEPVKETPRDDKKDPDSSFGKKGTSTRSGKSPKKNTTRR